ncbi:MAG: glycosyltransferase family 2 protein [Methylococcaceae bacterium]
MMCKVKPYFSIVIPTYNRAEKLKHTLESVFTQSFTDFEVLVMDDGSTDNTKAVTEFFHDTRLRYDWAPNSGGPATPRNRGINAAQADWICFLDADDLWYPDKLKRVHEAITNNPGLDLICHNEMMSVLATGSKSLLNYGPFEADFYRVMLTLGNRVSTSAATVRRDFLNMHNLRFNQSPDYVIVEDYDLWLRIAFHSGVFHFIAEPLGEYIIEDDNISSNLEKTQHNHLVVLKDHVYNLQTFQPDKDKLWRYINAGLLVSSAKNMLAHRHYVSGIKCLMRAFRRSLTGTLGYIVSKFTKIHKS